MKTYFVWDYYDNYGIVATCDTKEEAKTAAEKWREETDGECDLVIIANRR